MIYYNEICKRKLWYFFHEICLEGENENVQIGKFLDESTYNREEKHINIDNAINIDFIGNQDIVHEVKKSRKIEPASVWQVKYYLYYLRKRGVDGVTGKIDYPLLRQSITVRLENGDIELIESKLDDIEKVASSKLPPAKINSRICKSCAYYDLCYI